MNARKSWILAVLLLVAGGFAFVAISNMKKPPKEAPKKDRLLAPYSLTVNETVPLLVSGSGQVRAKNRIDLFSEVNGVLLPQDKDFRTGRSYRKGEVLLRVDDREQQAALYAQRSEYQNLITSLMPDIRLEFPGQVKKWAGYLSEISINKPLPPIPDVDSDKEKYFITGRKVYSTYYNIKNLEVRLSKYTLTAPFDGAVTESLINPGALVRSGQKLGTFSNTEVFEIEVAISAADAGYLKTGDTASLKVTGDGHQWFGLVTRINPAIDLNTQTVSVFIESRDEGLREGMFPTAEIRCGDIGNVVEVPRNMLVNNSWIYLIAPDSTLVRQDLSPVRFQDKTVLVNNLKDNLMLVTRNIPGAFPGMKVIPVQDK